MNIAFLGILFMGILPYIWVGFAKASGKLDNHVPRDLSKLTGYRLRAYWAHINQFEALPLFIAGVLVATYNHAPQHTLNLLTLSVVVLRIIHGILYMLDLAAFRSLVWFISIACVIAMFFI